MIIGKELRAWTEDRERQRRARRAADALAVEWGEGPVHRHFTESMAQLPERTAEDVTARVAELFRDDGWAGTLVETLAREAREDPCFEPPFRHLNADLHKGLLVYEDDLVALSVGVVQASRLAAHKSQARERASIFFSGQAVVLKFVRSGGARLSFWTAPPITAEFTAASAGQCERAGQRRIEDGEILVVDGRKESFVFEHAASNILMLQASTKPDRAPVSVEYDSVTGGYVGCSAADDSASRIQMISTLLRHLDCETAFGAIAAFLDHRDFFVRWHVMRELLGIDLEAALPHLRRMAARDPHPETRRVARSVLDRLEAPPAAGRVAA
jgi:hypothetical protein